MPSGVSNTYRGGPNFSVRAILPLGVGAIGAGARTWRLGRVNFNGFVRGIHFGGQSAITGTLTGEVFARDTAGGNGLTLQSAVTNLQTAFTSTALARVGANAALTATVTTRYVRAGQMLEVTIAGAATVSPGDLEVIVELEPRV